MSHVLVNGSRLEVNVVCMDDLGLEPGQNVDDITHIMIMKWELQDFMNESFAGLSDE